MFNIATFDVRKFDSILARGLSTGLGKRGSQVCIEAAICEVLDLPHGDNPRCVATSVRRFKIRLNDANWSSPKARAKGLRSLGLAQLGSMGVVEDSQFTKLIAEKTTRVLLPDLYRRLWPKEEEVEIVARQCELEGTGEAAIAARDLARIYAAYAYAYADATIGDYYLILGAKLALETLQELKSPGCQLLIQSVPPVLGSAPDEEPF